MKIRVMVLKMVAVAVTLQGRQRFVVMKNIMFEYYVKKN